MSNYKLGDFLTDINFKKENILKNDPEAQNDYSPYIINMMLSNHIDCILLINELNCRPNISKKMHYNFLIYSIRKGKRFAKNIKPIEKEDVDLIMEYYNYSRHKAIEALQIIPQEKLNEIRTIKNTGEFV